MEPESYYDSAPSEESEAADSMLVMEQAEFSWQAEEQEGANTFRLTDLNVNITKGQFVGIVGRVGSGKSSFLQAITANLIKKNGRVFVQNWQQGNNSFIEFFYN